VLYHAWLELILIFFFVGTGSQLKLFLMGKTKVVSRDAHLHNRTIKQHRKWLLEALGKWIVWEEKGLSWGEGTRRDFWTDWPHFTS
jgi:hypothetical protein